jgi:hypothetical protein
VGTKGLRRISVLAVFAAFSGCSAVPDPGCVKYHCDPSIDEQFKQNASWDARTQGEYSKVPAKN